MKLLNNFFLTAVVFSFATLQASILQKEDGEKIVYVDGVYDLAHYGHAKSFAKARKYAAKHFRISENNIKLLVGISGSDEEIKAYKRKPIFTLEQRVEQVLSFKGVDAVFPRAPMTLTNAFINEQKLDLVMHGDDFTKEKMNEYYGAAIKRGIFATFPYEPGISTSAIIKKVNILTLEEMLEKRKLSDEDQQAIHRILNLLHSPKEFSKKGEL